LLVLDLMRTCVPADLAPAALVSSIEGAVLTEVGAEEHPPLGVLEGIGHDGGGGEGSKRP
jgi:hypothetical protein